MPDLKQAFSARTSASSLLTSRFSKRPERYLEMIEPQELDSLGLTQDICGLLSRYHDMSGGRLGLGTALIRTGAAGRRIDRR